MIHRRHRLRKRMRSDILRQKSTAPQTLSLSSLVFWAYFNSKSAQRAGASSQGVRKRFLTLLRHVSLVFLSLRSGFLMSRSYIAMEDDRIEQGTCP